MFFKNILEEYKTFKKRHTVLKEIIRVKFDIYVISKEIEKKIKELEQSSDKEKIINEISQYMKEIVNKGKSI